MNECCRIPLDSAKTLRLAVGSATLYTWPFQNREDLGDFGQLFSDGASSANSMSLSRCTKQQSESIKESAVKLGFASSCCPSEMLKRSEDGM